MFDQVLLKLVLHFEGLATFIAREAMLGVSSSHVHFQKTGNGERLGAMFALVRSLVAVVYCMVSV